MSSMPSHLARVRITERTCGCTALSTKNAAALLLALRRIIAIASAAAVASSSSDAFATGSPVRSITIC